MFSSNIQQLSANNTPKSRPSSKCRGNGAGLLATKSELPNTAVEQLSDLKFQLLGQDEPDTRTHQGLKPRRTPRNRTRRIPRPQCRSTRRSTHQLMTSSMHRMTSSP